jgi:hypothetical protein
MENFKNKESSDGDFDQKSMKEFSGNAAMMMIMMMHKTSQQKLKSRGEGLVNP